METAGQFCVEINILSADAPRHVEASHGFDGGNQRAPSPEDFAQLESVLNDPDQLRAGEKSRQNNATVVATKTIKGETFRAVWEVLAGKRNRSLQLTSLVIKTKAAK